MHGGEDNPTITTGIGEHHISQKMAVRMEEG